jgi:hypothetical protein
MVVGKEGREEESRRKDLKNFHSRMKIVFGVEMKVT